MDLPLGGWLVVVFIVVWTVGGVRMLLRPLAERKLPYYAAVVLMLYGAFGFFGQALFSLVGPSWITEATELPVLWPAANIRDARGRTIVGLESAGRVQIYDERGRFVRGWFAGNGEGVRAVTSTAADRIEVFTLHEMVVFDAAGRAIERSKVQPGAASAARKAASSAHAPGVPVTSPFFRWPFANPFVGLGTAAIGGAMLQWANRRPAIPFKWR